jgi:Na+/H+-translocating membrane pyrophosphatase
MLRSVFPFSTQLGFGWSAWGAMALGLIAGILIGQITEYYTSYDCRPTQVVLANMCDVCMYIYASS